MTATTPIFTDSLLAAGTVMAYRCVTHAGAQATVQGEKVYGVANANMADGKAVPVVVVGTVRIESGAAVAVGDSLICDSQGRAIPATGALQVAAGATPVTSGAANGAAVLTGANLPEYVFADARTSAAGAGTIIVAALRR